MDARKIARIAYQHGAAQKIGEFSAFISFLKRRRLRTVVEIGTGYGGSLYAWCKTAQPDALIVSIDLPGGPFGGGYPLRDIKKFRKWAKENQTLRFMRKNSHVQSTRNELIRILKGREIDFLFLDGDHGYPGVKRDFELYSPLVKKSGLIALHDIIYHKDLLTVQVERLWTEIKDDYRHVEFYTDEDPKGWGQWGGIGVLYYDP